MFSVPTGPGPGSSCSPTLLEGSAGRAQAPRRRRQGVGPAGGAGGAAIFAFLIGWRGRVVLAIFVESPNRGHRFSPRAAQVRRAPNRHSTRGQRMDPLLSDYGDLGSRLTLRLTTRRGRFGLAAGLWQGDRRRCPVCALGMRTFRRSLTMKSCLAPCLGPSQLSRQNRSTSARLVVGASRRLIWLRLGASPPCWGCLRLRPPASMSPSRSVRTAGLRVLPRGSYRRPRPRRYQLRSRPTLRDL